MEGPAKVEVVKTETEVVDKVETTEPAEEHSQIDKFNRRLDKSKQGK